MATLGLDTPRPTGADLIAGLSVALVLIPQGMANATIAGMPPYVGLYASSLPLIVFALFASSPYLQTGPVALTSLLTFGALSGAGFATETTEYIAAGALLALIVGLLRLVLGVLRLGVVAYIICEPVMIGFTAGAAVVILTSQLPKAFGMVPPDDYGTLRGAFWAVTNPGDWQPQAVAIAVVTLVLMLGGRTIHALFPGVLVAVIGAIVYSNLTDYSSKFDGAVVGAIPAGFPPISFAFPWNDLPALIVGGLVIALVGFAEPSAIARTFAKADGIPWSATRELFSSGMANLTTSISGGFPIGGSFARSSVNRFSGAQTRWSGGVTGLILLAFLPFAAVLENLPNAVLGAVVVGAVLSLLNPVRMLRLWPRSRSQAVLSVLTFVATVVSTPKIQYAILFGVVLTLLHHFVFPVKLETSESADGNLQVRPTGLVWLASNRTFAKRLAEVAADHPSASLQIDLSDTPTVDDGMADAIGEVAASIAADGRTITVLDPPDGADDLITTAIASSLSQDAGSAEDE